MTVDAVTHSDESPDKLLIRMKVHGEMKKKNGEEAIEFPYDLKRDNVEEVVAEMVSGVCVCVCVPPQVIGIWKDAGLVVWIPHRESS